MAADGSFAIVTLPSTSGSRFVELALPLGPGDEPIVHDVAGEYVGLAHLAPDGQTMLLYTTVDPFMMEAPLDPGLTSPLDPLAGGSGTGGSTTTGGSTGDSGTTGGSTTGSDDGPGDVPSDQDPRQRVTTARRGGEGEEAEKLRGGDGLDLLAQRSQRRPAQPPGPANRSRSRPGRRRSCPTTAPRSSWGRRRRRRR